MNHAVLYYNNILNIIVYAKNSSRPNLRLYFL
jgi:hypothetical protein